MPGILSCFGLCGNPYADDIADEIIARANAERQARLANPPERHGGVPAEQPPVRVERPRHRLPRPELPVRPVWQLNETLRDFPTDNMARVRRIKANALERDAKQNFSGLRAPRKIEWLVSNARDIRSNPDRLDDRVVAGHRNLSAREALTFALEIAIESKKDQVPFIARELMEYFPEPGHRFQLFGVTFDSGRLALWANENERVSGAPTITQKIMPAIVEGMDRALYTSNSQNVHDDAVKNAVTAQFQRIQNRIASVKQISYQETNVEIRNFLAKNSTPSCSSSGTSSPASAGTSSAASTSTQPMSDAMLGFLTVWDRTDIIDPFHVSPRHVLSCVWNYIRQVQDVNLQRNLKNALQEKLQEIVLENPCGMGMIERIIDTPTAIDWSLTSTISTDHLRDELRTLAGSVNSTFEEEIADYIDAVRAQVGTDSVHGDPEAEFTALKRDRFLQTALIEFSMFRGLDPALVRREAEHVFPADMVL